MVKSICFKIETITPMFLSGADQEKVELRAPSIKGLIRYWWRALMADPNIDRLKKNESEISGSSDEKTGGGSRFSIRVISDPHFETATTSFPNRNNIHRIMVHSNRQNRDFSINILEYLAYGPFDPSTKKIRPYIASKSKFDLIIAFTDVSIINDVLKTIYVFSLFGGIGSRSRNGFGSFRILNLQDVFQDIKNDFSIENCYTHENIQKIVNQSADVCSYSSFSSGTRLFRAEQRDTWDEALAEIGKIYRSIRIGEARVNGESFENKHTFLKRQYIGAPLDPYKENFYSLLDRHSKPYFIKVAKENNKYRAYMLYLPSLYAEGLDEDRRGNTINNHDNLNIRFKEVCLDFNRFLESRLEAIL